MAAVVVLPPGHSKAAELGPDMEVDTDASTSSATAAGGEEDLYTRLKTLQRQLEFLEIQVGLRVIVSTCKASP